MRYVRNDAAPPPHSRRHHAAVSRCSMQPLPIAIVQRVENGKGCRRRRYRPIGHIVWVCQSVSQKFTESLRILLILEHTLGKFWKKLQKNNMFPIFTCLILVRFIRMGKSKSLICRDVLLKKSKLNKIASTKTNKIKKQTPLLKTNFS